MCNMLPGPPTENAYIIALARPLATGGVIQWTGCSQSRADATSTREFVYVRGHGKGDTSRQGKVKEQTGFSLSSHNYIY